MIEFEADPAGKQRHDELVEGYTLGSSSGDELCVKARRHPDEHPSVRGHTGNNSACAIDMSDSAGNIMDMNTHTRRVLNIRMEIEVDENAWNTEYGTPIASVEDYLLNQISQSPAAEAGAITVTGYVVQGLD